MIYECYFIIITTLPTPEKRSPGRIRNRGLDAVVSFPTNGEVIIVTKAHHIPADRLSVTVFIYNDEVFPIDIKHIKHAGPCFTRPPVLTVSDLYSSV